MEVMRSPLFLLISTCLCLDTTGVIAQQSTGPAPDLALMKKELQETRSELADFLRQIQQLQVQVKELRDELQKNPLDDPPSAGEPTVDAANQDPSFLAAKIDELHQDKVESASKFPVKLSGLVLFNSYVNSGALDAQDLPSLAFQNAPGQPEGSIGATLSQTLIGIQARGPMLMGGRSSADASFDFGGGSPSSSYGVTAGIVRLRTANVHLDWENTTLSFGQDTPFFSPLSPTSYATVREPALS